MRLGYQITCSSLAQPPRRGRSAPARAQRAPDSVDRAVHSSV